jgi:hypothetical protein
MVLDAGLRNAREDPALRQEAGRAEGTDHRRSPVTTVARLLRRVAILDLLRSLSMATFPLWRRGSELQDMSVATSSVST